MPSTDSSAEPNPARDARRRVRAERERRRAARALDRYMEIMFGPDHPITDTHEVWRVAGERFVEAVGDYVLSELHHNGDYGVPAADACDGLCSGNWTDPDCSFHGRPKSTIKPHYGVAGSSREFCGARREHEAHQWSDYGVPKMCGGLSGEDLRELEGAHDNTVKPSEICPRAGEPGHLHAWQGGRCVS